MIIMIHYVSLRIITTYYYDYFICRHDICLHAPITFETLLTKST